MVAGNRNLFENELKSLMLESRINDLKNKFWISIKTLNQSRYSLWIPLIETKRITPRKAKTTDSQK